MAKMDWLGKGINMGVGVLDGYLARQDQINAETAFMSKKANWLAVGGSVLGTGLEMLMPEYDKYASPVAASCLTLLGRSLYFELAVKEADRTPGISEHSTTFIPRQRVAAARGFADQPGVENIRLI